MNIFQCFLCAFTFLMTLAIINPPVARGSQQPDDETSLNIIATNAFQILRDVPSIGLEQSLSGIEQIIKTHHRLLRETDLSKKHFSLVLADAVAYALITEIHRADITRLGTDPDMTPKSKSFNKTTAVRLWKANMPDFPASIRQILRKDGAITGYISRRSCEEDVFSGEMIDKAPLDTIRPRIRELHEKALRPIALGKNPSVDEQFLSVLVQCQSFRDIDMIINLYENGDLPSDSISLRAAIDEVMKPSVGKRVDDGMKASAFKVWLTFRRYYPGGTSHDPVGPIEEYYLKQALTLAPFMTDSSSLPESAKKVLVKMGMVQGQTEK
ncbi:MAG: hypothetical protein PHO37_02880 [Kiritimatiellae bacterium]|nr:hypothetical protein [Kiritimatiellia bacterium]